MYDTNKAIGELLRLNPQYPDICDFTDAEPEEVVNQAVESYFRNLIEEFVRSGVAMDARIKKAHELLALDDEQIKTRSTKMRLDGWERSHWENFLGVMHKERAKLEEMIFKIGNIEDRFLKRAIKNPA